VFVPGSGSKIEVRQYTGNGSVITPGITFDVEFGILNDIHVNRVTTNSGGAGGTQRTRVGGDWNYALVLSFPAHLLGGAIATAFVQNLLGSTRGVWMRFFVSDPEFWTLNDPALAVRSFLGEKSLLSSVEQRMDARGTEVVGLNVAGESSGGSVLIAELDGVQNYP
jgi:hypothetical protein